MDFFSEIDIGASSRAVDAAEIPKGKLVNPMNRSGLALAGAQKTLQAWAKGEVPPTANDGIVTAEDVGGLKLDSTGWSFFPLAIPAAAKHGRVKA